MIKIPSSLESVLAQSPTLNSAVKQNFNSFEPWLEQSGMPFFPAFTDHSPRHINDVLNSAASLITDEGRALLSPEDVAVLCMAALLHDCGMHLTQDGFRALIEDASPPVISGLEDQPWSQLWSDFTAEAKRFGQEKLIAIYGDDGPIQVDEIDYDNLSERDCLLIGEFVRRHHARLAHEIAIKGVPSRKTEKLQLTGFNDDLMDLAGLIARSHGMPIRETFAYLDEKYSLITEQHNVKGPFLMAVIRIADYIQVKSERALKSLLSVKELRSPVSRQEWKNHFSVKDVSGAHNDPEVFFVRAAPSDVKTYLKLVALFKDIQRELDESWATIGEVYGRYEEFDKLGLTMRRVRSNLDSVEKFSRTVPYIPTKANFDTSGPDLLKLLVGPLYNYEYKIGIRELIQNSVDAYRELSDLRGNDLASNTSESNKPDVLVSVHENADGTGWITVTDKGIGMKLETVTKYFLIAGASFRNSEVWKLQHTDERGQSRILRGGRFGIGALAAFLLGDEIEVKTRHFKSQEGEGVEFKARIDEQNIELRRCAAPHGTTIKIWVSNSDVFDELRPPFYLLGNTIDKILEKWDEVDWFAQAIPSVECIWNGYDRNNSSSSPRTRVSTKFSSESSASVLLAGAITPEWNRLPSPEPYKEIYWKYVEPQKRTNDDSSVTVPPHDEITVNGIRVQKVSNYGWSRERLLNISDDLQKEGPIYDIRRPSLAIFDPTGICPINLQRSAIAFDRMGMDLALAKDILKGHLQRLIKQANAASSVVEFYKLCAKLAESRDIIYHGAASPICATSDGVFLASPNVFGQLAISTLYFVDAPRKSIPERMLADLLKKNEALLFRHTSSGTQNDLAWFRGVLSKYYGQYSPTHFPKISNEASVAILSRKSWELATEKGRVSKGIMAELKLISKDENIAVVSAGDHEQAAKLLDRCQTIRSSLGDSTEICGWLLQEGHSYADAQNLLKDTWLELNKNSVLATFDQKLKGAA